MIYPPNQKPPIWGIDTGIVAYNCQKAGIPRPILAMPLWEEAGDHTIDLSGYGNHGNLFGNTNWVPEGLNFDLAINDYISTTKNNSLYSNNLTISVWVKFDSYIALQAIIGNASASGAFASYSLEMGRGDNRITFLQNGATVIAASDTILSGNNLYNVGITRSGSVGDWTITYYLNGFSDGVRATAANPHDYSNVGSTSIGRSGDYVGIYLHATVKNVMMFNTALYPTQMKFIYENPYFMYQIPEELYGYVSAIGGWTGKIAGITNPAKINGVTVANITTVMGQ